jgi:hypothetical protein
VSKCALAITASRSGFGIPLRFVSAFRSEREPGRDHRLELERGSDAGFDAAAAEGVALELDAAIAEALEAVAPA